MKASTILKILLALPAAVDSARALVEALRKKEG